MTEHFSPRRVCGRRNDGIAYCPNFSRRVCERQTAGWAQKKTRQVGPRAGRQKYPTEKTMSKSGRNLWTRKISGEQIKRTGGKWTSEDIERKFLSGPKPADSAPVRESIPGGEVQSATDAKRLARNAKLRERYQEAKSKKLEEAYHGGRIRGKVLGIDPSLRGTGLSVIDARADGTVVYVESMTVKNPPEMTMAECLARIYSETSAMIARNNPVCAAIEQSVYVQNFKTALILGSSRGAAIAAAAGAHLEVFEYPPLRIKQAVIGYGRASKEQIAKSVSSMVDGAPILPPDEADASGAALTHLFTYKI